MSVKQLLAAAVFALVPAAGFAMCSGHEETANLCETGFTWDAETQVCVEIVSG